MPSLVVDMMHSRFSHIGHGLSVQDECFRESKIFETGKGLVESVLFPSCLGDRRVGIIAEEAILRDFASLWKVLGEHFALAELCAVSADLASIGVDGDAGTDRFDESC